MKRQEGGRLTAVTQDLDSTSSKEEIKTMLCVLRENVPPLLCFFPSSSGHTFFSEEIPHLRWNQSTSVFPLLSREEFV